MENKKQENTAVDAVNGLLEIGKILGLITAWMMADDHHRIALEFMIRRALTKTEIEREVYESLNMIELEELLKNSIEKIMREENE